MGFKLNSTTFRAPLPVGFDLPADPLTRDAGFDVPCRAVLTSSTVTLTTRNMLNVRRLKENTIVQCLYHSRYGTMQQYSNNAAKTIQNNAQGRKQCRAAILQQYCSDAVKNNAKQFTWQNNAKLCSNNARASKQCENNTRCKSMSEQLNIVQKQVKSRKQCKTMCSDACFFADGQLGSSGSSVSRYSSSSIFCDSPGDQLETYRNVETLQFYRRAPVIF